MSGAVRSLLLGFALLGAASAAADPLRVVATTPDLADLVQQLGGPAVSVEVLVKGPQDPHFLEPRPSFIRRLHEADLFVLTGMDLEIGWVPVLLRQARNARIQPGAEGYLDASLAIEPLEVPVGPVDRSQGDVHPYGNPHYLTDPLDGLRVAERIRERLGSLRAADAAVFDAAFEDFRLRLLTALAGAASVAQHGADALAAQLADEGFVEQEAASGRLAGWLGAARPLRGARVVQDHRLWAYFARRFGLETIATLEPRPGIAPTTRHLQEVVEIARADGARLVLTSPYFDARHARFVAEHAGARVVPMAHQVGARPGTDDYIAMLDYNVRQLLGLP